MPKIENEPITSPLDDESTIFKQIFFLHARKKVMPFKRDEVAKMHKPDFRNTQVPNLLSQVEDNQSRIVFEDCNTTRKDTQIKDTQGGHSKTWWFVRRLLASWKSDRDYFPFRKILADGDERVIPLS